jgi:predicted nucleic acid-binding protein
VIFGDSSYFIALADADDRWHRAALRLQKELARESFVVTGLTLAESVTHIGGVLGGKLGLRLFRFFLDSCEVVHVDSPLLSEAIEHWIAYDGSLSVSDAAAVAVMVRRGIRRVASFDDDFDRVRGIERLH